MSPIRGLTDRGASFPEIGRIRKGAPKTATRPGEDLDHFRVEIDTSSEIGEQTAALFKAIYPPEPRELNVVLPFASVANAWDAWIEAYLASGLIYRSDGKRVVFWIDPETGQRKVKDWEAQADFELPDGTAIAKGDTVPCVVADGHAVGHYRNQKGKQVPVLAKPHGRLKVIIADLRRFGYFTFVTTSQYDIANLSSQLEALDMVQRQAGMPGVSGIPLKFRRRKTRIVRRMEDGSRMPDESWLVSIEPDTSWAQAKTLAMIEAATPEVIEGKILELPAPEGTEPDEEETGFGGNGEIKPSAQPHPEVDDEMRQVPPEGPQHVRRPTASGLRNFENDLLGEMVAEHLAPSKMDAARALGRSPWAQKAIRMQTGAAKAWLRAYNAGLEQDLKPDEAAEAATAEWRELGGEECME